MSFLSDFFRLYPTPTRAKRRDRFRDVPDHEVERSIRLIPKHFAVGPTSGGDGTLITTPRAGKTAEATVGQAHGKYYEAASRCVLFAACEQGTGIAPGTALGTTALFALYNPAASGKRLAIKKVSVGYISGTLGAGTLYHCIDKTTTQVAPSSGTALTAVCTDIGTGGTPQGVPRVNATVAATIVAYRPFCSLSALLASTAVGLYALTEDVDGSIIIEPGCSYQLQGITAAGTSPKLTVGVEWEEIPVI